VDERADHHVGERAARHHRREEARRVEVGARAHRRLDPRREQRKLGMHNATR
jgi:hypothetical protein